MATISFWGDSITEGVPGAAFIDIVQAKRPQHTIKNYGKGGDTIVSLYSRLHREHHKHPEKVRADISFLCVGVNDILPHLSWFYAPIKKVVKQPWAQDDQEFCRYYRQVIKLLTSFSRQVWVVPPLFIGEDLTNPWNQKLEQQISLIEETVAEFPDTSFIDIRAPLKDDLHKLTKSKRQSTYLPEHLFPAAVDFLMYRSVQKADRRAEERGLHFTMDGVHLNSAGAHKVANEFLRVLPSYRGN